ncbi:MAG TPA: glycosyltransferase, partial [Vicinamibacterales bacterium]|nr:glycosyltransferase [Vicinamibacterales bacterium]
MTDSLLVTPENWFDLPRRARLGATGAPLSLAVATADGAVPLAALTLGELRAVHQTFERWRRELGASAHDTGLADGGYDSLLSASRAVLQARAEAALASPVTAPADPPALLRFPELAHPLLADDITAIAFLTPLFWIHGPSLAAWARALATGHDAVERARQHAWLRLVLQKVAAEDDVPEVVACLRQVYAGGDEARQRLRAAETQVLDACGLDLAWCASALGLDRPERTGVGIPMGEPRSGRATPADITVLVPSYKHGRYIETTLASVLAQTYTAFHVRVVDDRSPDDTVARARRLDDPRLRVDVNAVNLGLGDSVLGALEAVDTPFVALLNSDDLFHPERLERCRAVFERRPETQVVATGFVNIDAEGRTLTVDTVRRLFDGRQIADWVRWQTDTGSVDPGSDLVGALLERNFLVTSSNIVARTDFLRRHIEALRGLKYCLDWQVFLAAAADDALVVLPEPLLGYRLHGSNTVWFDDDTRTAYALEVNRVIAEALRQRRARAAAGQDDDGELAHLLEQLVRHAAHHSNASGAAMYANALVGSRRLEDGRARSAAVQAQVRALTAPLVPPPPVTDTLALAGRIMDEVQLEEQQASGVLREHVTGLEVEQSRLRAALDVATADVQRTMAERDDALAAAQRATAARTDEVARLRSSPEYLVGDRLWNRLGGSRIGWPMVRALHTLRDRRNRASLALGRMAHRVGLGKPQAVVAACWSFPIHSQTFVYQEMQALAWTGFACRVFCCDTNAKTELPAAFGGLWNQRLVMQTDWGKNQRDLEHFQRTRPERVESLLVKLAGATGLSREALLNESIVRTGFTFARHVELAGAPYLHTYFFYDQSFLGLIAAYLLQIPRGVTAYADHMLGDYQFKCVPLHLELADIVVATSRRIKTELGAIGGGCFDDKIIVKPNGIDVARFPVIAPDTRLALGGAPELIAVNRIEPKKGLIHLIDAMGLLKARGVAARLNLVGGADVHTPSSADCYRQLLARIEVLQLGDSVVLHGVKQQHEFAPLMARSRVFVAPYVEVTTGDKDGIPTAVLEAMSSGLPVVATDAGSIHECVTDGVEGLQV